VSVELVVPPDDAFVGALLTGPWWCGVPVVSPALPVEVGAGTAAPE
jgi:hypothetical protein